MFWSFLGEVTALDYSQVTHVKDKGGENRIELAKAWGHNTYMTSVGGKKRRNEDNTERTSNNDAELKKKTQQT